MTIPFHQPVVCPILIGRETELTALRNCLEAALHGQGGIVFLSGEAGIGKSRLVTELKRSAEMQNFQLLSGQCFPTDRSYPYAPLLDLVDTFLTHISPPPDCHRFGNLCRSALSFAARAHPESARTDKSRFPVPPGS